MTGPMIGGMSDQSATEALEAMTPNERAEAVRASIVTDPAEVPGYLWAQIDETARRIGEGLRAQ